LETRSIDLHRAMMRHLTACLQRWAILGGHRCCAATATTDNNYDYDEEEEEEEKDDNGGEVVGGEGGGGSAKNRSAFVATIGTREDLTRVKDAKCCIASMAVGEATRYSAREVLKSRCGNPERGRILPNRLHMRIHLLRLMRLMDHQI
jgi:hypothetical protein